MLTFIKRHYSRLFGSDTLKHEWLRFALSIITFFTMYLIMFSAMIVSDQRYYTNGSSSPRNPALRDLLYDVLPPVTLNYAAADKPIFVLGILTFVAIFMSVPRWLDALIAVRRFFWIGSIWVPLRAICVISTVLPPPSDWYKIDPIVVNASSFGDYVVIWRKIFARETATCTDGMFSGHVAIYCSIFIFSLIYLKHTIARIIVGLYSFGGISYIILARYHYTVDTVVGLIVAYIAYSVYFFCVERAVLYRLQALPYAPGLAKKAAPHQSVQQSGEDNSAEDAIDGESAEDKPQNGSRLVMEHDEYMKLLSTNCVFNDMLPLVVGWMDGVDLRFNLDDM